MRLIVFIVLFIAAASACYAQHWVYGYVYDGADGTPANDRQVAVYYPGNSSNNATDIIGPNGASGANNLYLIDIENVNSSWADGDIVYVKVIRNGSGYWAGPVNATLNSGQAFDQAADMALNASPTHSKPILNASDNPLNRSSATLSCYNQSTDDIDSDPVTNTYKWYKDDAEQTSLENSTFVLPGNTSVNERWICEITPCDTFHCGIPRNSSNLTIEPSPPNILYNASVPYAPVQGQTVYIYANVTDDVEVIWVNFTVTAPNGTVIIDNENASWHADDIWNSTSFIADRVGTWIWNITASDDDDLLDNASGMFTITSWQFIVGNLTGQFTIEDALGRAMLKWTAINLTGSNIYVADSDSSVDFENLKAISRNFSDEYSRHDFEYIDNLLNMTELDDSVNTTFTLGGNPIETANFSVYDVLIKNVAIVNSTNSSSFITGILWDSSDDDGDENFDEVDKEDLVFVTKVNESITGEYGLYDYEIRVPGPLSQYITDDTDILSIYTEIK